MLTKNEIILASKSKVRKEILSQEDYFPKTPILNLLFLIENFGPNFEEHFDNLKQKFSNKEKE